MQILASPPFFGTRTMSTQQGVDSSAGMTTPDDSSKHFSPSISRRGSGTFLRVNRTKGFTLGFSRISYDSPLSVPRPVKRDKNYCLMGCFT